MTIFISKHNVGQFGKIQSAKAYGNREDIVILWDELTKKQKGIAEHIDIDVSEVQTSDPSSVPDKWSGCVSEMESEMSHIEMIKNIVANPARGDVYDMLVEEDPSEPLMLWWLEHVFNDEEFAIKLADICQHALFKTDSDYIWSVVAYGVEAGVGKFSWPEKSNKLPKGEQELKKEMLEQMDIREKELDLAWDGIKMKAEEMLEDSTGREAEELDDGMEDSSEARNQSSLLDIS